MTIEVAFKQHLFAREDVGDGDPGSHAQESTP